MAWSHLSSFLVLVLISFSLVAQPDLKCEGGEIRYLLDGKMEFEKSTYCYNADKTVLLSYECVEKKCAKSFIKSDISKSELSSVIGAPGFSLCRKLSGTPQIIEFRAEGKWWELDRCVFQKQLYLDSAYLFRSFFDSKK